MPGYLQPLQESMAAFQSLSGKPPSWPAAPGLSDFLQQYQFGVTVAFRRPQTIG